MRFNLPNAQEELVLVARALGERTDSQSAAEAAEQACLAVSRLASDIGLPQRLRDVGVREEQIPGMAEDAMADWCHPFNPRPCSAADMVKLYRTAF
jgi:alcohol dehydrogenase class IV